jgi:hypothetical protein
MSGQEKKEDDSGHGPYADRQSGIGPEQVNTNDRNGKYRKTQHTGDPEIPLHQEQLDIVPFNLLPIKKKGL